ncbi:hypothetical protein JBKA6_0219 [Ichthyobacterium seriolicida]|uniref:Uncharacterized protein n=1 Tax=Ichthyobacterium seriolicida TaxID=242600 RepID=A0A1J1E9M6_9FLAO|nr:hypothetical protein JBKA6_0219 [Ichthyobacterium seriolicida]
MLSAFSNNICDFDSEILLVFAGILLCDNNIKGLIHRMKKI